MKLWIHRYQLHNSLQLHPGILFKFEFTDQMTGYADLHPWPELGDLSLQENLALIKKGEFSIPFRKAMLHAQIDAQARTEKKNLFKDLKIPRSHFFAMQPQVLDQVFIRYLYDQGFRTIKMKITDLKESHKVVVDLTKMAGRLDMKLRLDFNSKFSPDEVFEFFDSLRTVAGLNAIEFVEDPFKFSEKSWVDLKSAYGLKLALDRELKNVPSELRLEMNASADILIFKPAMQMLEEISNLALHNKMKMVVTTNLDHSLGILAAVWEAGLLNKKHPELLMDCGLISHQDFKDDGFFSKIKLQGTGFQNLDFVGFGFEEELKKLNWEFFL